MKLLVVDDDRYAREGILSSLPLEELDIHHVMQTQDGKTALEIVRWFCPDVIITDICMPRMDGMQFASAVRRVQPECQIIFITGYAEIAYLKQAIELAAVAFVEKPLQQAELLKAVKSACERHQEKQSAHHSSESLMKLRRQQAAVMLLRTSKQMDELEALCGQIGFPLTGEFRCLAIRTMHQDPHEAFAVIKEKCAVYGFDCIAEFREERVIHLVLAGKRNQGQNEPQLVESLLKRLPDLRIGEGRAVHCLDQVYESRKDACRMLEGAFFDSETRFFPYTRGEAASGVLTVDVYAKFVRLLEESRDRLPGWLDRLLNDMILNGADRVENVRALMHSILKELYRRNPELYGKIYGISNPHELEEYVQSVQQAQQYREMLSDLFAELAKQEDATSRFAQVVRDAKIYIAEHIHQSDLGLKEIAAQVNFSAAYLNVVFRTETGMTVKQYLIECRMREAKRLLRDPNVRVSEIALRCGYSNANYFTKAFRVAVGMSPGEYREGKMQG